jgi:hypothetical protein
MIIGYFEYLASFPAIKHLHVVITVFISIRDVPFPISASFPANDTKIFHYFSQPLQANCEMVPADNG